MEKVNKSIQSQITDCNEKTRERSARSVTGLCFFPEFRSSRFPATDKSCSTRENAVAHQRIKVMGEICMVCDVFAQVALRWERDSFFFFRRSGARAFVVGGTNNIVCYVCVLYMEHVFGVRYIVTLTLRLKVKIRNREKFLLTEQRGSNGQPGFKCPQIGL